MSVDVKIHDFNPSNEELEQMLEQLQKRVDAEEQKILAFIWSREKQQGPVVAWACGDCGDKSPEILLARNHITAAHHYRNKEEDVWARIRPVYDAQC